MSVKIMYEEAVADLKKFCDETTDFEVMILSDEYPMQIHFIPRPAQTSVFDAELIDENGEIGFIAVSLGISTVVRSTLDFRLDGATLKKLIKKSEKVGFAYLHYFRSEAGDLAPGTIIYSPAVPPDNTAPDTSRQLDGYEPLKLLEA